MNRKELEFVINENGCHIVTSHALDKDGYGKITRNGMNWQIHRYVYTQIHGEIPEGLVVMHSCDNPPCINPNHLSLGTHFDNSQDMLSKKRAGKRGRRPGPFGPRKTAPDSVIAQLRISKGLTQKQLSEIVGIHQTSLAKIERGQRNGSIESLRNIASALGVGIDELLN